MVPLIAPAFAADGVVMESDEGSRFPLAAVGGSVDGAVGRPISHPTPMSAPKIQTLLIETSLRR
jgi:hypothetical protein